MLNDLRFAFRMLRKNPGFTAVAILTLAFGIGGSTAIFSVLYSAVLDPFRYLNSHGLMMLVVRDTAEAKEADWAHVTVPEFRMFQEQNRSFEEVMGFTRIGGRVTGIDEPIYVYLEAVTTNAFRFLGVGPLMGRTIMAEDGKPDAPAVAVLSYEGWERRFSADPGIVGRQVILMDRPTTIIGVMPRHSSFDYWADLWMPVTFLPKGDSVGSRLMLIGRLKPGVTAQQASAEADVLAKSFAEKDTKDRPKQQKFAFQGLIDIVGRDLRGTLFTLLGAVGLILLIACANVGNLLLARMTAREKEIALRASLGATRMQIIRQLMVESLLLGLSGAVVGSVLAWSGLQSFLTIMPMVFFGPALDIRMNSAVLVFVVGLTQFSTLLFGLAPVLFAVRRDLQLGLGDSRKGTSGSFRHGKLRSLLVVSQVALSLILLSGAGLLIRNFLALRQVKLGYRVDNVLTLGVKIPKDHYPSVERRQQFFLDILERVRALPGVISAAIGEPIPPLGTFETTYELGVPNSQPKEGRGGFVLCSDDYPETLGIRILEGQQLTEQDVHGARKVALINQTLANRHFSGGSPLGRRVKVAALETWWTTPVKEPWFEIIGVVADVRHEGPEQPPTPVIYLPFTLSDHDGHGIFVHTAGDSALWLPAVRSAIHTLGKDTTVDMDRGNSLRRVLTNFSLAVPTFDLILLCLFAAVGLTVTSVGTYGVLSYTVRRRTHEIGIRIALGASAGDVMRMFLTMGLRLLLAGIGIGIAGSIVLTRLLANRIWGIKTVDSLTLVAVSLLLTVVGLGACYFPARQATKVDPMVALRCE